MTATTLARRGAFLARVVRNQHICTDHFRLTLALPHFPPSAPGQFVQIQCATQPAGLDTPEYPTFDWTPGTRPPNLPLDPDFAAPRAYLRRPFSIAARRDIPNGTEIDIIHRVVGRGTAWLADLAEEAAVSVLGPLGNRGFSIPEGLQLALLVGGGVGIPPMFYLAETLARSGVRAVAFVGAQRQDLVPLTILPGAPEPSPAGEPVLNAMEFAEHGFPTVLATDDGSWGLKGFVTAALQMFLARNAPSPEHTVVYCCGPTPMMKATAHVAAACGVPCQVSLEQPMACGMGTCQSCVIKYKTTPGSAPTPAHDWVYKLTCTDGPVFDPANLIW